VRGRVGQGRVAEELGETGVGGDDSAAVGAGDGDGVESGVGLGLGL